MARGSASAQPGGEMRSEGAQKASVGASTASGTTGSPSRIHSPFAVRLRMYQPVAISTAAGAERVTPSFSQSSSATKSVAFRERGSTSAKATILRSTRYGSSA